MATSARAFLSFLVLAGLGPSAAAQPDAEVADAGSEHSRAPYFVVSDGDPTFDRFPLLSTAADVTISGVIADVRVTQTYKNEGTGPIEAVYVFPASTRAAVYGLKMTIGERTIVAQIQEREQARRDYEQAKREGKSASLLEQHRPNVFQMSVANILPGDRISVELSYTELLVPVGDNYELVFPTVVGPRYLHGAPGGGEDDAGFTANPTLAAGLPPSYDLAVNVRLDAGMPLHDLGSPSHRVRIVPDGPTRATVTLDPTETAGGNRDFILRYRLAGERIASGLVLAQGPQGGSFLLMVQPPRQVTPADLPPREYIFIMDVSGSMHGFPLEISKQLFGNLVTSLRPIDRFNIVLFESSSTALAERSVPATRHNLAVARCFLDRQQGSGGTELLPALKHALGLPRVKGVARTVVLATDGYVDVEAEAMRVAQQSLGDANLFAFGIGSAVNRFLIEALARVGRGEPTIVTDEDEAAERAEAFRSYIAAPVLTSVRVRFDGFATSEVEPPSIPDVFASRPVIVFGKWQGERKGTIVVRGRSGDRAFAQTFDVAQVKVSADDRGLRSLWARSRIESLSDLEALRDPVNHRQEITDLGLRNSLLTKYTAFAAIDSEVRNETGDSTTIRQPLPMPAGVSNLAVGGLVFARQSAGTPLMMLARSYESHEVPKRTPAMQMGNGELEAAIGAAVNMTSDQIGEPVRVPLALRYGASPGITLGLHSREGFCLTGSEHGCPRVFNQLGVDGMVALAEGRRGRLALRFALSFASLDPAWPRLGLGLPMQRTLVEDRLWLWFEPGCEWGLSDTASNAAAFVLPLRLQLLAVHRLSFHVTGGLQAAWTNVGKRYVIPAGLGLELELARWLDVAAEVTFAAKAGSEMPEAARRIFYDSAASIAPAVYDRLLFVNLRLRGDSLWSGYRRVGGYEGEPPSPARPMCEAIEW